MPTLLRLARRATAVALAASALTLGACDDDDPILPPDEPETTQIVLTIAGTGVQSQTITWNTGNGALSPATLTIPRGASRTVSARFLRQDGSDDPIVNANTFRLDFNVQGNANGVTITKNGAFAATITAPDAAATTTVQMELFHLEENHEEYVANVLTISVP